MTATAAEPGSSRAWLAAVVGIVIAVQLVVANVWPGFDSPNERARAYQAIAVVTRGSLEIGPELTRLGGMEDVASFAGRRFPNKAPGLLPLVLPGAFVAHALAHGTQAELAWTLVLGRWLAASLPFVLTVLLLARATATRFPHGGPFAVAAYALATPALAASLLLFAHALTACLLLAAFLVLFEGRRPRPGAAALTGLLLAWAATCEYTVALPAAVLILAAVRRLGVRGTVALGLGGAIPTALLGAYNAACFGSPLSLSTAHEAYGRFAALVQHGFFGISLPSAAGLAELLLSPARGLFVWAPVAAFSVVGALVRSKWPGDAAGRCALWIAPLALLLAMSGYPNAHGGWFPGPRYLLPVLPLVFLLVARWAEVVLVEAWGRILAGVAVLWGLAMVWPCLASFPFPPEDVPLPALTLAPGLITAGIHTPSRLPGALVVPVFGVAALAAGVVLLWVSVAARRWYEPALVAACFAVTIAVAGQTRFPLTWQAALERAVILDIYAGPKRGALETLAPRADSPARRMQLRTWIERRDGASH